MTGASDDRIFPCQGFTGFRGRLPRAVPRAVLLAVLGLAGCGWHPLYERPSPDPTSGGVGAVLAQIAIDPVTTLTTTDPLTGSQKFVYDARAAQMLQSRLRDGLNPYGQPSPATYHLAIVLSAVTHASVLLGNGQSTREDLVMRAKYKLNDEKGVALLRDEAQIVTSYDVVEEPFSDLSSKTDALQRGTQQLAETIQTRLSVFLTK